MGESKFEQLDAHALLSRPYVRITSQHETEEAKTTFYVVRLLRTIGKPLLSFEEAILPKLSVSNKSQSFQVTILLP